MSDTRGWPRAEVHPNVGRAMAAQVYPYLLDDGGLLGGHRGRADPDPQSQATVSSPVGADELAKDDDAPVIAAMRRWHETQRERLDAGPPWQNDRVADYILIGLMAVAGVALIVLAFVWGGNV